MTNSFPENDTEYREYTLDKVVPYSDGIGYELSFGSYGTGCSNSPIEPKAGMTLRLYGPLFGTIRGMFIDGVKVYYRTEEEQKVKFKQEQEERDNKSKQYYLDHEKEYNDRIVSMPKVYQDRISKFRGNNPDFNWKFLDYELFCCEQSLVIAKVCRTPEGVDKFSFSKDKAR